MVVVGQLKLQELEAAREQKIKEDEARLQLRESLKYNLEAMMSDLSMTSKWLGDRWDDRTQGTPSSAYYDVPKATEAEKIRTVEDDKVELEAAKRRWAAEADD